MTTTILDPATGQPVPRPKGQAPTWAVVLTAVLAILSILFLGCYALFHW